MNRGYWLHAYSQQRRGGERLYANSVDQLSPAAFLKKLVTDFPESASLLHWSTEITKAEFTALDGYL